MIDVIVGAVVSIVICIVVPVDSNDTLSVFVIMKSYIPSGRLIGYERLYVPLISVVPVRITSPVEE